MKIQKNNGDGGRVGGGGGRVVGGGVGSWGSGWGGQGGCERRIEVFEKTQKKIGGVGGSGGGSGWWGFRVDVNAMLGVGVKWGMGM